MSKKGRRQNHQHPQDKKNIRRSRFEPRSLSRQSGETPNVERLSEVEGLSYARDSRTFYYTPPSDPLSQSPDLLAAVKAFYKLSGDSSIFFSPTFAGLIANLCGHNVTSGRLRIIQSLSEPDADYQRSCLLHEEWTDIASAISNFANKNSYNLDDTEMVFRAICQALGKSSISSRTAEENSGAPAYKLIDEFEIDRNEIESNGKVTVRWNIRASQKCECFLSLNDRKLKVAFQNSKRLAITEDSRITLSVVFGGKVIDSAARIVTIIRPAEIRDFQASSPSPVLESVRMQLHWTVANATKIVLIRKTNDHNAATIDVTSRMGSWDFTAQRTEIFELKASNASGNDKRSIMVEVKPLPKFDTSRIPELTQFTMQPPISIPNVLGESQWEVLTDRLRRVVLPGRAHGLQASLSQSVRKMIYGLYRFLEFHF